MPRRLLALVILVATAAVAAPTAGHGEDDATQTAQVRVDVDPLTRPVDPGSGPTSTTVTVEVPCGAVGQEGSRAVNLTVPGKPRWVTATVSPSTVHVGPGDCETENGTARVETELRVETTHEAPAFSPANVTVRASSDGLEPGSDDVEVQAAFYAVLDVQTDRPVVVAEPASQVEFPVELANLGNGPVAVTAELTNRTAGSGLEPVLPGAVGLGAEPTGGNRHATVTVAVETPERNGYVNEGGELEVTWTARYGPQPSLGGDASTSTFRITTKGFRLPAPGAAAVLPALAAAALVAAAARPGRR